MRVSYLIFAVVLAFCAGSGSARDINEVIFHALDVVLRDEMRNGNPYTGFPVMAPYQASEEAVSLNFNQLVELDGDLKTVRIEGLDGYFISEVHLNLLTMRLSFDFAWPQLLFTGWYNLNGRFAGLVPIFGNGNYHIDPKSKFSFDVSYIAAFAFSFKNDMLFSDVRGSGYATIQFVGPNSNLNIADMNVKLNLQSFNVWPLTKFDIEVSNAFPVLDGYSGNFGGW